MPIKYLEIPVDKYGTIKVEIEPTDDTSGLEKLGVDKSELAKPGGFEDLGRREDLKAMARAVTAEATSAFDEIVGTVHTIAYGLRDRLDKFDEKARPDEASVTFGLAIKADAGVVLAQVGSEGSLEVQLTWKPSTRLQQEEEDVDKR
jgi:hypothetical protein